MKTILLIMLLSVLQISGGGIVRKNQKVFGGMQLPDGYSVKKESAVDAEAWSIEGKNGFIINFESGPNEGSWANPDAQSKYDWFRQQSAKGHVARFALTKPGLKTQWDSGNERGLPPGNILLVTFLLDGSNSSHTANFSAKIANSGELADALLIITSFNPRNGKF